MQRSNLTDNAHANLCLLTLSTSHDEKPYLLHALVKVLLNGSHAGGQHSCRPCRTPLSGEQYLSHPRQLLGSLDPSQHRLRTCLLPAGRNTNDTKSRRSHRKSGEFSGQRNTSTVEVRIEVQCCILGTSMGCTRNFQSKTKGGNRR